MFPLTEEMYDDPLTWCIIHACSTDESCCCPKCEATDKEFRQWYDEMFPDSLGG